VVLWAAGCSIDDSLVGGQCAAGYVRCGDHCCPSPDGSFDDATGDGANEGSSDVATYDGAGQDDVSDDTSGDGAPGDGAPGDAGWDAAWADAPQDDSGNAGDSAANSDAGCVAPLVDCGGVCVDLSSDDQNCGHCSNKCPANEICVNGACGQLTGGVVYIGSDFATAPSASQRQVLLNSANLASTSPIRVLSYEQYAQAAAESEVNAILTKPDYVVTHTSAPTAVTMPTFTLQNYGVLLVHDQALAPHNALKGLGASA
jgi:hypothetical protein